MNDEEQAKRCLQCPSLKTLHGILRCERKHCVYEEEEPKPEPAPKEKPALPTLAETGFQAWDYVKMAQKRMGKGRRAVAVGLGIFIVERLTNKNKGGEGK